MIRRLTRLVRSLRKGFKEAERDACIEKALENLEYTKPMVARVEVLIAESEGRRHLEVVDEEEKE